ncbi:hypothetical protein SELMODRAFT_404650 [Selaginella moellendorffii]|uniref:EngC GTPase domain-containing protein n=1 Tax=Selaginella moellendorffii TaxID=88036 RepID=D8QVZ7_SELML|nr:hypothetical protein SELMODRAFT_404650 [Selaginella moellendorffii]
MPVRSGGAIPSKSLASGINRPRLDPVIMNRFLVEGESTGIPLAVVLSKADLVTLEMKDSWEKQLMESGYKLYICSVETGMGPLHEDKTSVVFGPSGVRKSSLINFLRGKSCLPPDDIQALDEVDNELLLIAIVSIAVVSAFTSQLDRPGYNSRRLKISTKEEQCLISSADKSVQEMDRLIDEIDSKSCPRVAYGSLASHEQQSSSNINLTTPLNPPCLDKALQGLPQKYTYKELASGNLASSKCFRGVLDVRNLDSLFLGEACEFSRATCSLGARTMDTDETKKAMLCFLLGFSPGHFVCFLYFLVGRILSLEEWSSSNNRDSWPWTREPTSKAVTS